MSVTNVIVGIMCDVCESEEGVSIPATYTDISEKGLYLSLFDNSREIKMPKGWVWLNGGQHACPDCVGEAQNKSARSQLCGNQ